MTNLPFCFNCTRLGQALVASGNSKVSKHLISLTRDTLPVLGLSYKDHPWLVLSLNRVNTTTLPSFHDHGLPGNGTTGRLDTEC